MKQKHTFFVTVGIPSLFLIFSVLCLCVLALLTLGSSRSGLNTARYSRLKNIITPAAKPQKPYLKFEMSCLSTQITLLMKQNIFP